MSDFLSRLAARAAGDAPAAHPRVPGRFAGSLMGVDVAAPTATESEAGSTPDRASLGPPRLAPPVPRAAGAEARHPSPPVTRLEPRLSLPSPPPSPPTEAAQPISKRVFDPSSADAPAVHRREPVAVGSMVVPAVSGPVAALPLVSARPATTARAEPRDTAATSMVAEASAEPVVQISIGRVEVRATIATPVAAPRPAAADRDEPHLALRDYLRGQR